MRTQFIPFRKCHYAFGTSFELRWRCDFIPGHKVFRRKIESGGLLLIDVTVNSGNERVGERSSLLFSRCGGYIFQHLESRDHKLMKLPSVLAWRIWVVGVLLLRDRISQFSGLSTGIRCTVNHINPLVNQILRECDW